MAAIIAAILGVSAAFVIAICTACGTMGNFQDCYNTILTTLQGGYC
jgi:hypothetical protein